MSNPSRLASAAAPRRRVPWLALSAALLLAACATTPPPKPQAEAAPRPAAPPPKGLVPARDPYPSTYAPAASGLTAIVNANIYTGAGQKILGGMVVFDAGKIVSVGPAAAPPAGARVIDAKGRWVTPGLIDAHSHLGVFPAPAVTGQVDVNENIDPNTGYVWAEHSVWPQDAGFERARAGGVTSLLILPGSANLFGGRTVALKNVPAVTVQAMKFPGAPYGLKMACGENPKGRYGARGRTPATRMGNVAGYRRGWIEAADYGKRWAAYDKKAAKGDGGEPPKRDLTLDTLSSALNGELLVQNHCYRADEMANLIDVSHEFGYHITAFHHAVEAYKIAPLLAREGICAAVWSGRWGFKMEAYDGIEENAALLTKAGVCVSLHSDDPNIIQRLNREAAVAQAAGRRAGIVIPDEVAIQWITLNSAKVMGVADRTGSLEPGKMADIVLWSADPLSIYALADLVFIDGAIEFDRQAPRRPSDFELGQNRGDLAQ
ncbi:amidohydrolase [Caulobacter sp.]|uniref:amidohydrolase n=1 Tax=Caulobacter sp. TaxID=78 RepID=UPI002B4778F8|nr:amidohydrolase [Caulobacter sp.]HJV43190.1 amidohydrolase [Caulobacter sp.]